MSESLLVERVIVQTLTHFSYINQSNADVVSPAAMKKNTMKQHLLVPTFLDSNMVRTQSYAQKKMPKMRLFLTIIFVLQGLYSFAIIHTSKWDKFDGTWTNDSILDSSLFSITIEKGENEEVSMDFRFRSEPDYSVYFPVYAPLSEEGGECTDILWGGPNLLTHKDLDDEGNLPYFDAYKKGKEWSYILQQVRSNTNGVILFEVETNSFPLTDDYSIKAQVEHELGLLTATAEYCITRIAYAAIPKSINQLELICLGMCKYCYGTDRNGNYGFVGGLFDNNTKFNGRNRITLNR